MADAFEDLATLWATYIETMRDADTESATNEDVCTLVSIDLPDIIAAGTNLDDRNTLYAEVLTG